MRPNALVITAPGINCDLELVHALEQAGAAAGPVHLNRLIAEPALLEKARIIGLPGGFSYGDSIAAGRIFAQLVRRHLYRPLVEALGRGVPIIAPCNGFQIAAQAGLLPGPAPGEPWPDEPPVPTISLRPNAGGRFVDRWTRVVLEPASRCIWTAGLDPTKAAAVLPSAHGEGRFKDADDGLPAALGDRGQIAVRYAEGENFNGSADRIAGLCDASGLLLGLMPHPERWTRWTQHPSWTRVAERERAAEPLGLRLFRNAVEHVVGAAV